MLVSSALLGDSDPLSQAQLGDMMVETFNHLYINDQFYPGQHPLPRTNICRFCNSSFPSAEPQVHAQACQERQLLKQVQDIVEMRYPIPETCGWASATWCRLCKRKGKDFNARFEFSRHLVCHGMQKLKPCRFGDCVNATEAVPFASAESLYCHLLSAHGIVVSWGKGPTACLWMVYWCGFCCRWFSQLDQDMDIHASGHQDLVNQVIALGGYAGVELGSKMIQPALCSFCVHDHALAFGQRFRTLESKRDNSSI